MSGSVIFFGTECDFASIVFNTLARNGHEIVAFVIPGEPGLGDPIRELAPSHKSRPGVALPMASGTSSSRIDGHDPGTRRFQLNDARHESSRATIAGINADFAVVACYPRRLPVELVESTRYGGLNIHPSLLPRYRGPDPLFWIYRNGELHTGVTIHQVDAGLDTGPIAHQERLDVPVGTPGDQLWRQSAELGARLLIEAMDSLSSGTARPVRQEESDASYYSWPASSDLVIRPEEWEAWRVFHFCRGVLPLGHMPRLAVRGTVRRITAAIEYSDQPGEIPPFGEWIQCRRGAVLLQLAPEVF